MVSLYHIYDASPGASVSKLQAGATLLFQVAARLHRLVAPSVEGEGGRMSRMGYRRSLVLILVCSVNLTTDHTFHLKGRPLPAH